MKNSKQIIAVHISITDFPTLSIESLVEIINTSKDACNTAKQAAVSDFYYNIYIHAVDALIASPAHSVRDLALKSVALLCDDVDADLHIKAVFDDSTRILEVV